MPGSMTLPTSFPRQPQATDFDADRFRQAVRDKDADAWSNFFAADAEWLEYRDLQPPQDPKCRRGNLEIHRFLTDLCDSEHHLHVEDLVVGKDAVWFRMMVRLEDGRMVIEHVHLRIVNGLIQREIDVEAWDYL